MVALLLQGSGQFAPGAVSDVCLVDDALSEHALLTVLILRSHPSEVWTTRFMHSLDETVDFFSALAWAHLLTFKTSDFAPRY